jgi:TolB protein
MNTPITFIRWLLFSVSSFLLVLSGIGCNTVGPPSPLLEVPRDEAPSWSPDGNYIAYNHFDPDAITNPYGLYLMNLGTGERNLVIEGPAFNPDWSPDGEWIAFNSGDIFKIRPDGSDLMRLTGHGMSYFPRWSPDGNSISYGRSGSQEVVGLWFFHLPDSSYTKFGFGSPPADWSLDGQQIVYGNLPQYGNPQEGGSQIWKADTSNSNYVQLSSNDIPYNRHASWSPDGQWIAWQVHYGDHKNGLWVMRSDGSNPHEVLSIETKQTIELDLISPSWSPDSQIIVFSKPTQNEEKVVLWIINKDGSGLKQITF